MAGIRADVTLNVNTSQAKRSMDRAAAEINKVVNNIGGKQVSFNVNSRSFTQPLGRITASANEFTKSLEASNARVIAFGASVGIINGVSDAFRTLVVETVKFEKTLADINVVLNASSQSLERFGKGLFDVARNTAQAFNVSATAALEFSRQGLTMEEVLKRTNDALTLTRLTGLKAEEAVSGLTAAVNAFGDAGLTTTDIIDKLAAVDVKFAVSSKDLINALERTGAVAIDAGVELDNLIGLVTALQQTTARGGSVIGNGLKTIFTRIQRPESIRQLEQMGVAVRNLRGEILPADKIMIQMAKSFDNLSQSQQSNIVQFSAGIFQANIFRAALRDLSKEQSIQAQATKIAGEASGDAAKKNEVLNKTIAAMASQTMTSIEELSHVIGDLAFASEAKGFLGFVQEGIEGLKNMLGGGEDQGNDFAKGLVRGIGNVLTGPAAIAFGAIFIKLFVNISKFANNSLKDVLGIVSEKDKIKAMEESITKALGDNLKLQEGLNNLEGDRKAQEQFILGIIEKQNAAMKEQAAIASRLAKPLVRAGINPDFTQTRNASSGIVPDAKKKERDGAAKGGYSAGAVDSMNVPGIGKVIYNKREKIKRFPGMTQPAIMPPEKSKAGDLYKDAFAGRHGFDPYAYGGLIPNFASLFGSKLILDKSRMGLVASPNNVRASSKLRKSYQELVQKGMPVNVEASMRDLTLGQGGSHTAKIKEVLSFLKAEGVTSIERLFDLQRLPYKGRKKPGEAEAAVLRSQKNKNYFSTGGKSGDETFPVDIAGLGLSPLEVKSGEWTAPNLLMKSLRLYSDDGLLSFAKSHFGADERMISEAREEKFKKSSGLLRKKGILGEDASRADQESAVLSYILSGGLVPNFSKKKEGSIYATDAELLRDVIDDLDGSRKFKYGSLKDIVEAYSHRISGLPKSFGTKLSRFRSGKTLGAREGISKGEAAKLRGLLNTKVPLGATGKRTPMSTAEPDQKILDDMMSGLIAPAEAARKHGFGANKGTDHSVVKTFKKFLKEKKSKKALNYILSYGKEGDDFKEDRELSTYLGLNFQRGESKPNIDIPAGKVGEEKLKEIGLGLSGKTDNWEVKRSLQFLTGKGIRQMLFEHRHKKGGLIDIINSFDSKNPSLKEARSIDITEKFGGALAIPGTRGKNYPTGTTTQLSTFRWKAMNDIFKAKFGENQTIAKKNKSIVAEIMAEEYNLSASKGLIPSFAELSQLEHFEKYSYGRHGRTLDISTFFPKSGTSAISKLFKDVISKAKSGEPYEKIVAGNIVGPRIPRMMIEAKKTLDNARARGLNQPPMEISGYFEPYDLFYQLAKNKRWYEFEKSSVEKSGKEFKPSAPGTGIKKASMASKYVPREEEALSNALKELGLPVDDSDRAGGFREFHRHYLKNLPLFKNGFARGFLPNFQKLKGMGEESGVYDAKNKAGARSLNIAYLSSMGSSGPQIFKNLLKQITAASEEGNPYTEVNTGQIVGPRIPTVILKAKKILDRQRASGKNIPFMNIRGAMDPPARLLGKLQGHKQAFGERFSSVYVKGEEKQLLQSFKELGLNPESWETRDLDTIPMLRTFSKGFTPNFANPLSDAISREKAAGVPPGSIRLSQSDELRNSKNPMGLAITNTRDEPMGVEQGIRRSKMMGIDPKRHGASSGLIPNYANADDHDKANQSNVLPVKVTNVVKTLTGSGGQGGASASSMSDIDQAYEKLGSSVKVNTEAVKEDTKAEQRNTDVTNKSNEANSMNLQKLFYLQSSLSLFDGFLEQFAKEGEGATKKLAEFGLGLSSLGQAFVQQKTFVSETLEMANISSKQSVGLGGLLGGSGAAKDAFGEIGKGAREAKKSALSGRGKGLSGMLKGLKGASKGLGFLAKGALRFVPILGQLYTGFTAVNEIFKLFNDGQGVMSLFESAAAKSARRLETLNTVSESLATSMEQSNIAEKKRKELTDILNKGDRATFEDQIKADKIRLEMNQANAKQREAEKKMVEDMEKARIADFDQGSFLDRATVDKTQMLDTALNFSSLGVKPIYEEIAEAIGLKDGEHGFVRSLGMTMGTSDPIGTNEASKAAEQAIKDAQNFYLTAMGEEKKLAALRYNNQIQDQQNLQRFSMALGDLESITTGGTIKRNMGFGKDQNFIDKMVLNNSLLRGAQSLGFMSEGQISRLSRRMGGVGTMKHYNQDRNAQKSLVMDQAGMFLDTEDIMLNNIKDEKARDEAKEKHRERFKGQMASGLMQAGTSEKAAKKMIDEAFKAQEAKLKDEKKEAGILANQVQYREDMLHFLKRQRDEQIYNLKNQSRSNSVDGQIQSIKNSILSKYKGIDESISIEQRTAVESQKISDDALVKQAEARKKAMDALTKLAKNISPDLLGREDSFFKNQDLQEKLNLKMLHKMPGEGKSNIMQNMLTEINNPEDLSTALNSLSKGSEFVLDQEQLRLSDSIQDSLEDELKNIGKQVEEDKKILKQKQIQQLIEAKTVKGAFELAEILPDIKGMYEAELQSLRGKAATLKVVNDRTLETIPAIIKSQEFLDASNEAMKQKLGSELKSSETSALEAEYRSRNFKELRLVRDNAIRAEKANLEIQLKTLQEKRKDLQDGDGKLLSIENMKLKMEVENAGLASQTAQLKNQFYSIEQNRLNLARDQLSAETFNLNTTNLINQERQKQLNSNPEMLSSLVGGRIMEGRITAQGNLQNAVERFNQTGSPEDRSAVAEAMAELNKEMGNGTRAADALRLKLAEMNLSAANLGADLVNIGIEQTRSGLKEMFKSIGTGAKSASEAWSDFGLGLAESLLDRIMEHNIDRIMGDLSHAFTGQDLLVDATTLNTQALRDNTASLQQSSVDSAVLPKQFNKGGFVTGPAGIDKVPAMLTAGEYVVPKEDAQYFRDGTGSQGAKKKQSRIESGLKGVARLVTMQEVSKAMGKVANSKKDSPPTFDRNKFKNMDLRSDVNIARGDPRLSARFLARDPVMQEYKDYLLEKAAYENQKKNEKVKGRMGTIGSLFGAIASFAISGITSAAAPFIKKSLFGSGVEPIDTKLHRKNSGGSIPAMLTAGEGFVPAAIAKRIGYDTLNKINKTGQMPVIQGRGGIDKVGPVGLTEGDFIIKKNSTDKLLRENPNMMKFALQNPDGFRKGETGYYNGGVVGGMKSSPAPPMGRSGPAARTQPSSIIQAASQTQMGPQSTRGTSSNLGSSETTNNINVNVTIDQSGQEKVSTDSSSGSYEEEQKLSMKIKSAVLDVIREEKRIGGELS